MTARAATSLLAVLVAVSSAGWAIYTAVQATEVPVPWLGASVVLLPNVAAVAAAVLVLRAGPWWRRAALAYLGALTALEALGLVRIVPYASQFHAGAVSWSVATSMLALVTAVLAVVVLRREGAERHRAVPGPFRWPAVLAGLLVLASSTLAWGVSAGAPGGRMTFTLGHASIAVWVGTIAGMVVVAGITAVVATGTDRSVVVGATGGLLASRPLAVTALTDRTWQDADMVLAAGWWLALVAQVLLVVALVGMLARGRGTRHGVGEFSPTRT